MAIGNILTYQELMDYADVFDPKIGQLLIIDFHLF